jgi:hypothetical protein
MIPKSGRLVQWFRFGMSKLIRSAVESDGDTVRSVSSLDDIRPKEVGMDLDEVF